LIPGVKSQQGRGRSASTFGVGIIHEPTGQVHLKPFDAVPGGHVRLAGDLGLPLNEVKGFVVGLSADSYQAINASHLSNSSGQGASGTMQMPQALFASVLQSLKDAGL
jgi:hypothetical protein